MVYFSYYNFNFAWKCRFKNTGLPLKFVLNPQKCFCVRKTEKWGLFWSLSSPNSTTRPLKLCSGVGGWLGGWGQGMFRNSMKCGWRGELPQVRFASQTGTSPPTCTEAFVRAAKRETENHPLERNSTCMLSPSQL